MVRTLRPREVPLPLLEKAESTPYPTAYLAAYRRRLYLLVTGGEQKTAGYQLRLSTPADQLDQGRILVELESPPPHAMVAQVITHPYLALDLGQGPALVREVTLAGPAGRQNLPLQFLGDLE